MICNNIKSCKKYYDKMISKVFQNILIRQVTRLPKRFFSEESIPPSSSLKPTEIDLESSLNALSKTSIVNLNPETLIGHLSKLAQVPTIELTPELKQSIDEYFEDNFKKITAVQAVELIKHCSLIKGTQNCFWIWYNGERLITPQIFNLTEQQLYDVIGAFGRRYQGSDMLWYDIYRALGKIHANLKFLFTKQKPFDLSQAYIGEDPRNPVHPKI